MTTQLVFTDAIDKNKLAFWPSLFLLSTATFAFEINLTRLFSVAQFYHFAFMIVSIALLGYGASGTLLAIFPVIQRGKPALSLSWAALGASASILVAYLLTNWLPFDSYSMVWDRKQVFILLLHHMTLAAPFFFSGIALAILLAQHPEQSGSIFSINLLGSALGCIIAFTAPVFLTGEGMVTLSSLLAGIASLYALGLFRKKLWIGIGAIILLVFNLADLSLRLTGATGLSIMRLHLSPYKGLSYALQSPGAVTLYQKWNAFSRVDVVSSGAIHALPGLSYRYLKPLPSQQGLFVDGDDLNPIIQPSAGPDFSGSLPSAVVFELNPHANTLILEPRGGLDIFTSLVHSDGQVTSVELNSLIVNASPIYSMPRVQVKIESERSFLWQTTEKFDVILLSLISSFHPVQSGAYTLAEDYRYTVESFQEMLEHLSPGGYLVSTRWLQDPPSEDLRLFALAVTAIDASGGEPRDQIVAFRGYNTITILTKNRKFTPEELDTIRNFTHEKAFDLTYAPGISENETNLYNILPDTRYFQTYLRLLETTPRQEFYRAYPYDVRPPTDDHPFFGHYFKWAQTPQILAEFGKAWLPFGGGGYLVLLALLILAILLASGLIILPVWVQKMRRKKDRQAKSPFILQNLIYYGLLGFAFLFVEIPLFQRFILYLGNPAYAFTTVLFALLFFSGLGSYWSKSISLRVALVLLILIIIVMPIFLPALFEWTLGLPLTSRLSISILALSPIGFLMGIPFPAGIKHLLGNPIQSDKANERTDIAWIWAVNGAASVVAPILAALLALAFNFSFVLWAGAFCYAGALVMAWVLLHAHAVQHQAR